MKLLNSRLNSQRGQGTIEYVLLLVLSISIILGVVFQMNSAFRAWADNYFGEYLSCLLEAGELPSLQGGTQGVCDQEFKPFKLADGRAPVTSAEGSGASEGGGDSAEDKKSPARAQAGTDGGGADMQVAGSGAGGARRFRARQSTADDDGSETRSRASSNDGAVQFNSFDQGGRVVRIPVRYAEGSGRRRYLEDEKEPTRTKVAVTPASVEQSGRGPTLIKKPLRQPAALAEDEAGIDFGLGWLLRILIIGAIIIAIIIVIGGQILQVSKSLDKD